MSEFRLLLYSYESFAKIAQASAMRVYSQIAERRFIFCKDKQLNRYCQTFLHLKTFSSFFPPFYLFTLLKLRVDSPYYFQLVSGSTTNLVFAAESHRPYSCYSRYSCSFKSPATETSVSYSCHSRYSCSLNHSSNRDNRPIRDSRYYFSLTSGSSTNLVFVSLTRTFRLSLFALHSQTSLPVPTSPPSCISTARCPPQPRYSHQDHLSQPTYP